MLDAHRGELRCSLEETGEPPLAPQGIQYQDEEGGYIGASVKASSDWSHLENERLLEVRPGVHQTFPWNLNQSLPLCP